MNAIDQGCYPFHTIDRFDHTKRSAPGLGGRFSQGAIMIVSSNYVTNDTTADRALQYADEGLAVFPVWGITPDGHCQCGKIGCKGKNRGKHPSTPNGLNDATTNQAQVKLWFQNDPGANIGIVTGKASGIIVLDVDGPEGLASLAALGLSEADTLSAKTGSGGRHLYFAYPGYSIRNSASKIAAGLDIRADGGYVVAPGSKHVSGNRYEWLNEGGFDRSKILTLPEKLAKPIEDAESQKGPTLGYKPTIPAGERNDVLYREGCKLRGLGWSEDAIYTALKGRNQDCEEPLPDEDIRTIAHSAASHDPNPVLDTFPNTDVGNGERLVKLHGHELRYMAERKKSTPWLFWDGRRWTFDKIGRAERFAKETIRETYELADTTSNNDLKRWARETESRHGIARMVQSAQSEKGIAVTEDQLDQNTTLFNVGNGTLDLEGETFLSHNPKQLITKVAGTDYDPEAPAPEWERFLADIFDGNEALISYVQRVAGYTLTGDMREQAIWIAYGGGANGKSTFLNILRRVMGDYGTSTPFTTFEADNRNQYGNDVAALKGTRFVSAVESEQDKRLAEARVKAITGGDPFTCKFLYAEYFTMQPQFKVWLAVNHKPTIRGMDRGIWRRIKLIPFTQKYEGKEDRTLESKLAREFPGILNWMLEGLRQWQQGGLAEPAVVTDATKEYQRESDTLGEWIEERCKKEQKPGLTCLSSDLFKDYRRWAEDRGEIKFALSQKFFSIQLGERGYKKERTNEGTKWGGLWVPPPAMGRGN